MTSRSAPLAILEDQIHLWSADLDDANFPHERAYRLLSPEERERAQRFRFPMHRRRYTIRRGMLRTLLGRYLDVPPQSISFSYGSHGKPALPEETLHFNQSHSGSLACFAFSSRSPLGVDVERIRPIPDMLRIASSFCSSAELAALKSMPPEKQVQAFFRCWTKKEAFVKALGQGLSCPLENFSVSFDESAPLVDVLTDPEEQTQWHFHIWDPEPQYLGAVVSRHPDSRIVIHRFTQ